MNNQNTNLNPNSPDQQALNPNPQNLDPKDPNVARDPVCGNLVDKRTAQNTISPAVNDPSQGTIYFDTAECKATFEENPERFGYTNF